MDSSRFTCCSVVLDLLHASVSCFFIINSRLIVCFLYSVLLKSAQITYCFFFLLSLRLLYRFRSDVRNCLFNWYVFDIEHKKGWATRIRTWAHGTKTRCLTAWL